MEDKKCRICGLADMDNLNIFQSKTLPAKIVAVYPIALYRNDPLPKHICKKCHLSTLNMYNEMERAIRNQTKWIANIRLAQPDNQYLKVVDSITGANKQTSQLVSLIAGSEIGERTISKLFNIEIDHHSSAAFKGPESDRKDEHENDELTADSLEAELNNQEQMQALPQGSNKPPETKITQLKSVLELNGCTLTKLKPPTKNAAESQKKKEDAYENIKVDIKEEPLDEDTYATMHWQHYETNEEHQVRCKMCPFSCETIEELAIHQIDHLSITAWKLSERRILNKRIRRGRLIMAEDKKCIRCLNCWRIFADNKSILHHWSEGDCDFFCQICGKEFATSPKMLREHIPAAHGISYRSSKILRPANVTPRKPIKIEKSPAKLSGKFPIKNEPSSQKIKLPPLKNKSPKHIPNGSLTVKVACSICLKVFANFKARNSHMRAHKHPPFLPAQPPPSLNETLMALNRTDMLQIKEEPVEADFNDMSSFYQEETPIPSTSRAGPAFTKSNPPTKHPRLKVIPTRTGVKKKNVQTPRNPSPPVVIKTEPGLMPLVDLQDPSISSQLPEDSSDKYFFVEATAATSSTPALTPTQTPSPMLTSPSSNGATSINGLSIDFGVTPKDNMNYGQIFTCHPCGLKFNSKLELFRHKRKCSANNLFPCQFCERHFITSADLQMHIMLLHKNSSSTH